MGSNTKIEWTDASWTPVRARNLKTGKVGWHCEHATTGCEFCYAETLNKRVGTGLPFKPGHRSDIEIFLDDTMLLAPLHWKKPRMIFVCSMTDLFADFVPDEWIDKVFAVMALCPQHTFQVLTKRAARMRAYCNGRSIVGAWKSPHSKFWHAYRDLGGQWEALPVFPLPNVWLGVSTERQKEADERIPLLLQTPAAVRFISAEPLLGHIALHALNLATPTPCDALRGVQCVPDDSAEGFHNEPMNKLDWVIVGGESGSQARPMHPQWARDIRDWCQATGVPFFFKQWGDWKNGSDFASDAMCVTTDGRVIKPTPDAITLADTVAPLMRLDPTMMRRVGKKAAGRLLDGISHDAMPARRAGGE